MHELLRSYAAEKLKTSEKADVARDSHSAYYAEFLHQREADLKGRRQLGALDEIEADFENARAAWNWALKVENCIAIGQLLRSLGWFCTFRSRSQEHKELLQQARRQLAPCPGDEPHPVWGRILVAEFYARPHEIDRSQVERGLAIAERHRDLEAMAVGVRTLGEVALDADDYPEALSFFEESLVISRELEDRFNIAAALFRLAETYRLIGQTDTAIKYARQSLDLSRKIGDRFWAASSLVNTGTIAFFSGEYSEAEAYVREANTIYHEMGYREGIASSNVDMGKLAFAKGDFEKAKTLATETLEIATDIGRRRVAQSALDLDALVARTLGEKTSEPPDEDELTPVTDLPSTIDRFEVKELLGAGSVGSLYLAYDPENRREVAIKMANPEALRISDRASRMFNYEAEVQAKLAAHPAFAEFRGRGETADSLYIVLEYIDGEDLEEKLGEQKGFLPEEVVIEWAIQICDALTFMHSQKPELLIHRDVKPSNVMVEYDGKVRLIDLGIVEPYRPGRELPMIGTEGYSPPEQYFGYTDARSDLYALGATLHHLLTRRDPREETPFSFHDAPPRSLNPAISEELEAVILRAVEHNPEDRHQSAEELKTALLACR
jgi:tetratricopeptide (TPR) repeat protein